MGKILFLLGNVPSWITRGGDAHFQGTEKSGLEHGICIAERSSVHTCEAHY